MMDLLARRDHSEKEIRQKLSRYEFKTEDIEAAIAYGKKNNWLPDDLESASQLSEKTAKTLHRKKKGAIYINQYLQEIGLPKVQTNSELELEKALELVKNKYLIPEDADRELKEKIKARIGRFLISRGFEMSIVRKVVFEKMRGP